MSGQPSYRDRDRSDRDRDRESSYGRSGRGSRGRGYKPARRYWDNDEYYKDDRGREGRRRRRSYSRSRSRSYSSGSRSRSRTPPSKRDRSRSPPTHSKVEEYVPSGGAAYPTEPYVPSRDPANDWTAASTQEYVPQPNGQASIGVNPYMGMDQTTSLYGTHYPPPQSQAQMMMNQGNMAYGYGQPAVMNMPSAYKGQQPYAQAGSLEAMSTIPPNVTDSKSSKEDRSESKKKKERRKKKKRQQSSSSSSSSSDDSSEESKSRRKSKRDASSNSSSDEDKRNDSEQQSSSGISAQQKEALMLQRKGYQTKLEILEREIMKLRSKEDELIRGKADGRLIEENLSLQAELKGRCKAVNIVLEKIDDVLKVNNKSSYGSSSMDKMKAAVPPPPSISVSAPAPVQRYSSQSDAEVTSKGLARTGVFNYFDNGEHWCRLCNVFPDTVESMLQHFHSKEHHDQIQQLGIDEKPWHKRKPNIESHPAPGARKAPFRGMQFFSPVEGWYCRLCNYWMGDPHCAVDHLKSEEHNSNYMNFLEEHPDWEKKWVSDRERALGISGKVDPDLKRSRFLSHSSDSKNEDVDAGKSIRVQMRNALKTEEREGNDSRFTSIPILNEPLNDKDSNLDEWMNKPKVTLDIIDTQKFAEIVRQKHGSKEKESRDRERERDRDRDREREGKGSAGIVNEIKAAPTPPVISSHKERERDSRKDDRRRTDKVEMQISSRDKDRDSRDRYRDRDSRSSKRRSRSRSRSRSRDKRYRRRSRSRSRSRSRDRSDRGRRDKGDRDRADIKESTRKLPMIGKMPLYKRPAITKEKQETEESKALSADITPSTSMDFLPKDSIPPSQGLSMYADHMSSHASLASAYVYDAGAAYGQVPTDPYAAYASADAIAHLAPQPVHEAVSEYQHPTETVEDAPPGVDAKDVKEDASGALPDDFQQALDIIYSAPGGNPSQAKGVPAPQPVPAPGADLASNGDQTNEYGTLSEYGSMSTNGYGSYMGYQPYQQSFDGYAPYDELDDGPPGVNDTTGVSPVVRPPPALHNTASAADPKATQAPAEEADPPPPGDDDIEDLRMLGIDVDDTAASSVRH